MVEVLAIIGFGEAAAAFVAGWPRRPARLRVYDRKTDQIETAVVKRSDYVDAGVIGVDTLAEALAGATVVLSLVTADQAVRAAASAAPHLAPGALWLEMNSVAPDTKRAVAQVIAAAGGCAVDVAVMAAVHPARAAVPLLLSGFHAEAGAETLRGLGFANVRVVPGDVGQASAIKMIRSVVVKGMEALTAECVLAANQAGVLDEVLASLDASPPPPVWRERADYNLDRMLRHGLRRAAEMEEVVTTLDALGTSAAMTKATVQLQHALGRIALGSPTGLANKIATVLDYARSAPRKDAA